MSVLASNDWNLNRNVVVTDTSIPANFEETSMREKLLRVRDTLIVLGLQLVFRAMLFLRRWNY